MKAFLGSLFSSKKHVFVFFTILLGVIILTNAKWGYGLLGNDNFSPELNPTITLQRSLQNPGWRTYRALGVPSDSEQADTIRALMFYLLSSAKVPYWAMSQIYFFGTLVIALVSAGKVAEIVLISKKDEEKEAAHAFLFGGLFYFSSLLTVWIYYFPVHLFVAAYAFLPLVFFTLLKFSHQATPRNALALCISAVFLGISGLTATLFLVCFATLVVLSTLSLVDSRFSCKKILIGLGLILALNAYWLVPFSLYVQSNTHALQDSLINRKITTLQVQNEQKYTVLPRTLRYGFSWMDDQLSDGSYAYTARSWYTHPIINVLAYLPIACALFGVFYALKKRKKHAAVFSVLALLGVFLIKGSNTPLGFIYSYLQDASSVFNQVFRWRSSKFWPLLAMSLPLLATYGALHLTKKRPLVTIILVVALCVYMLPMLTGSMIRPSMYTQVPSSYFALADHLQKTNPTARIYVVPEANTLYFRNYSWGFFGSVMLNYVLPNPTFEKALIIGSSESEHAFNEIKNAYYTGDPDIFNNALDRYNIAYVLEDRSVSKGESGYDYDLSINDTVLRANQRMTNEWAQGDLALFAVAPSQKESSQKQQKIEEITPLFSQIPQDMHQTHEGTLQLSYKDISNEPATFTYPVQTVLESPAQATIGYKSVTIKPAAPRVTIDGNEGTPTFPSKTLVMNRQDFAKISFDSTVLDPQRPTTLPVPYSLVDQTAKLRTWLSTSRIDLLKDQSAIHLFCHNKPLLTRFQVEEAGSLCGSGQVDVPQDTVIEANLSLTSSEPVQLSWCFSSVNAQKCVQSDRFYTLNGHSNISLTVPIVLQAGDTFEMFLQFVPLRSGSKPHVAIDTLEWTLYSGTNLPYTLSEELPVSDFPSVELKKDYEILVDIPYNGGDLHSLFEARFSLLDAQKGSAQIEPIGKNLRLRNTESVASLHATLPVVTERHIMVMAAGKHLSGIPADIALKSEKQGAALYENQLYAEKESLLYGLIEVPRGNPTLSFDISTRGIGDVPSSQHLSMAYALPISDSWLDIGFVSDQSASRLPYVQAHNDGFGYSIALKESAIVTLNTAYSPYWRIRKVTPGKEKHPVSAFIFGEDIEVAKHKVNGWEQGFEVKEEGTYVIIFWPNYLIYTGYLMVVGIIGGLGLYSILKKLSVNEIAQTKPENEQPSFEQDIEEKHSS